MSNFIWNAQKVFISGLQGASNNQIDIYSSVPNNASFPYCKIDTINIDQYGDFELKNHKIIFDVDIFSVQTNNLEITNLLQELKSTLDNVPLFSKNIVENISIAYTTLSNCSITHKLKSKPDQSSWVASCKIETLFLME